MTFVKKIDTNEYPNIFASKKITRMNIRIYSYNKFDTTECLKKIFVLKIVRILEYIWIFEQFLHSNTLTNKYPNIFVQSNLTRTNVRIYSYRKIGTNECPNKYLWQIYLNIRIFEYIRHTLFQIELKTIRKVKLNHQRSMKLWGFRLLGYILLWNYF